MRRRSIFLVIGAAVMAVVLILVSGWLAFRAGRRAMQETIDAAVKPQEEVIDVTTLVTQVRELNRLETASMRVIHLQTLQQSYKMIPNAVAGDEITFLAAGDVIAGVDLSQLKPGDVWREPDGTIALRLPPSQILISRVDNKESRVVKRKTGALRRSDPGLETRARQHAEEYIRQEALRRGVLKLADDTAERKLAEFLRATGVKRVRFVRGPAARPIG